MNTTEPTGRPRPQLSRASTATAALATCTALQLVEPGTHPHTSLLALTGRSQTD